ncbi:MAG: MltA domain-containing protein, partial [Desulfoferrobacter sp.]
MKIAWAICLLLLAGCPGKPTKESAQTAKLERVPVEQIANLVDDLDPDSLKQAIKQSIAFYDRVPPERTYKLGHLQVQSDLLKATLIEFLNLMNSGSLDSKTISKKFDIYRFQQGKEETNLFLTGYYEPILQGRLERNAEYRYPLYSVPPDLLTIDLNSFNPELYAGKTLRGRLVGKRVVPYFTRAEIDGEGKLQELGCEMVWLRDELDVFFLQIQGSGMIQLPAGKFVRVGYAASNGRPYRSIGKYLLNKGVMNREEISLQSIRAYLKAHPEVIDEVLWHNESYVFFR